MNRAPRYFLLLLPVLLFLHAACQTALTPSDEVGALETQTLTLESWQPVKTTTSAPQQPELGVLPTRTPPYPYPAQQLPPTPLPPYPLVQPSASPEPYPAGRPSSTPLPPTRTIDTNATGTVRAATGTAYATAETEKFYLRSVAFIDPLQGWGWGSYGKPSHQPDLPWQVRRSRDGGLTWERLAEFPPADTFPAGRLVFVDAQLGWLYGPELFTTRDGGVTWEREDIPGEVTSLVVTRQGIHASVQICSPEKVEHCQMSLWRYGLDSGWAPTSAIPELAGRDPYLVTDADTLWLMHTNPDFWTISLNISRDGGAN